MAKAGNRFESATPAGRTARVRSAWNAGASEEAARQSVLVVNAAPAELRALNSLLSESLSLSFATDGLAGLHRAQSLLPNLILMDTCLPGIDGLAACRLLKADGGTSMIPVIFISARSSPEERVSGLLAGAVDYVCKPVWPQEVLARVRVHLAAASAPKPPTQASLFPLSADPDLVYVDAARKLIAARLAALPTVAQLAQEVGTGERRLRQLFLHYLGKTIQTYISELRIAVAAGLLERTSMTVHAVAVDVGFSTPGNFTTAFRTRTGLTPLLWRRRRRDQWQV